MTTDPTAQTHKTLNDFMCEFGVALVLDTMAANLELKVAPDATSKRNAKILHSAAQQIRDAGEFAFDK